MGQLSQSHDLGGGLKSRHVTMLSIAGVIGASGPAINRAGSPGSIWTNKNTSTETINSVGINPSMLQ